MAVSIEGVPRQVKLRPKRGQDRSFWSMSASENPKLTLTYGMTFNAVLQELGWPPTSFTQAQAGSIDMTPAAHGRHVDNQDGSGMADDTRSVRVMVIDDSKTIRRTAETLLQKEGFEVITATDGFDALSKIADTKPSIIFVDIMMPRLDGYQTCALIKNNQAFKSTPVVMLSSKDGLFDKAKGRIVGSDQYLTKPFSRDELLGAIRQLVPEAAGS